MVLFSGLLQIGDIYDTYKITKNESLLVHLRMALFCHCLLRKE